MTSREPWRRRWAPKGAGQDTRDSPDDYDGEQNSTGYGNSTENADRIDEQTNRGFSTTVDEGTEYGRRIVVLNRRPYSLAFDCVFIG